MFFSSDPAAVSSSIFVGAEREELIRNDPDKSEFIKEECLVCTGAKRESEMGI